MKEDEAQKTAREIRRTGVEVRRVREMVIVYLDSGDVDCANTASGYARLRGLYAGKGGR